MGKNLITTITNGLKKSLIKKYNNALNIKNIHVHQLYDFCLRRWFLAYYNNLPYNPNNSRDAGTLLTRAIGIKYEELAHELLQEAFSGKVKSKLQLKLPITNNITISGEVDIVVGKYIVEIKSMKPDDFEGPLPQRYITQVRNYLALAKLTKVPVNTDAGILISFCKLQKKDPFKVYIIHSSKECMDKLIEIKNSIPVYLQNKQIPNKICTSLHCYTAKACHLRNICFKED